MDTTKSLDELKRELEDLKATVSVPYKIRGFQVFSEIKFEILFYFFLKSIQKNQFELIQK